MSPVFLSLLALAGAVAAQAQTPLQPLKIGKVTVQGSFRTRLEAWDWFEAPGDSAYQFSGNLLRLGFGQQLPKLDWQIEFAAPFLLGLPDDAIRPAPQLQLGIGGNYFAANSRNTNAGMVFVKQAFLRFKKNRHSLRVGRYEFLDGTEATPADPTLAAVKRDRITQRILGNFGWAHVGRSLDGAQYVWNSPKLNLTALGALPTRGVFQVDGWGNLNVAIGYAALTGQRPGKKAAGEWRVLGSYYDDWRPVLKTDNRPAALRAADTGAIRIGTFGGHYLQSVTTSAGVFDAMFWGLLQTGRWGALDHRSGAAAVEGGWQPKGPKALKPWLRAGVYHGGGDANPLDGRHGTFFQLLPTPRPYARFPFFNLMNNQDLYGMLTLRPHRTFTVKSEVHAMRLAERADLWYIGGGPFQPWSFGYIGRTSSGARSFANLYDISADYNPTPRYTVSAYFGHAAGHSVVRAIYPAGKNANLGYLEFTYRF